MCGDVEVNMDNMSSFSRNINIEETKKVNHHMDGVSISPNKILDCTSNIVSSKFPLHRCMRIVPHDQNSGAFFIAVLHKLSPLNGNLRFLFDDSTQYLSRKFAFNLISA